MNVPEINKEYSRKLKKILELSSEPVAIKFYKEKPAEEIELKKMRYCQLLMEAREGNICHLTESNITCPAAAAALGFKLLPDKIRDGAMLKTMGLFESKEAASKTMQSMARLKAGEIQAVMGAPLEKATFQPDLVIIEDKPEKIMWLALASIYKEGGRLSFDTAVFQATCVDVTTVPYVSGEINACFGCYGCRDSTDMSDDEALIGIPWEKIDELVSSLEALSLKAIPKARSKGILNIYRSSEF